MRKSASYRPLVSQGTWEKIQRLDPVVSVPRAISTGHPVMLDCLLPAQGAEGYACPPDWPVGITRMLSPEQTGALELPGGKKLPADAMAGVMPGPGRGWPVLALDHAAFMQLADAASPTQAGVSTWMELLPLAAVCKLGLAMEAPGDGLCPVFAPRRWGGAAAATLVSTPLDCATVCLDVRLCACLTPAGRLDWNCLRQALIEAVRVANSVLDEVSGADALPGGRSAELRRLALHLSDLGELAVRLGMQPRLPSTLSRLQQVVKVASDAALGESLRLGRQLGPFPALEAEWAQRSLEPGFRSRISALMERFWLRNSQLLALSPCSIMGPAVSAAQLRNWANLIPLLAGTDGFSARLPPAWSTLPTRESACLLGQIWALGRNRHRVKAY
jgi:hypothetical protein